MAGLNDLSYYKGKLYLYFGATPALVLFWPYAALTGHYLSHKDAVVIFFSVGFLAGAALLCAVWRRCFAGNQFWGGGGRRRWLWAWPISRRRCWRGGDVYEVAISCGYALTMLALAGVWGALQDARRGWRWLAAASLAYGLAVGARPSLLFGAVILLVPVAQAWREKRPVWPLLLAAGGPIVLIGLGMMVYNALRFDNPLEFGQRYQLPSAACTNSSVRATSGSISGWVFWSRRVGAGVFHSCMTLRRQRRRRVIPVWTSFGVLTNIPLVWLALAAPLAWRGRSGEARSVLRGFVGAVALLFGIGAR